MKEITLSKEVKNTLESLEGVSTYDSAGITSVYFDMRSWNLSEYGLGFDIPTDKEPFNKTVDGHKLWEYLKSVEMESEYNRYIFHGVKPQ